eukprot:g13866.t1
MKPGAFLLLLRPAGDDFEVLLQHRAAHLTDAWCNPGTWGLVGGMLSPEERWIYRSNGLPEWLWKRVLRRAALREALEEMGGSESDLAKAKIIFEPLCVQVTQDGQVVRLGRKVVEAVVPAGLTFMEVDEQRSRPLRIGSSHTFVFRRAAEEAAAERRQHAMEGRSMIHLQAAESRRTLLTMSPELFHSKMAGDRSFLEIVKEEVRSRMGIPYLRQKLMLEDQDIPFHSSWQALEKPRELTLLTLDYVDTHGQRLRAMAEAGKEPNAADENGETAALKACRQGHMEMLQLLRYADADLTLGNNDGETPLLLAAQEGHTELVELLLECGAEKESSNCWGETAVLKAAENNHVEILRWHRSGHFSILGVGHLRLM